MSAGIRTAASFARNGTGARPSRARSAGAFRVLVGLLAGVALTGCSAGTATPPQSPTSTAMLTSSPTPTPTAILTSSPTPAPSPTFGNKPDGSMTWTTDSGVVKDVPVPAGLKAVLEANGTINYVTVDARYGVKAANVVGGFRTDVCMTEAGLDVQIGGLTLESEVVAVLMQIKLASISSASKKVAVPSPVDPSSPVHVEFASRTLVGGDYPTIAVRYIGSTSVESIFPDNHDGVTCSPGSIPQLKWICFRNNGYGRSDVPAMSQLMLFGQDPTLVTPAGGDYPLGGDLVTISDEVDICGGAIGHPMTLDSGSLLSIGGSWVMLQ